MVIAMAMLMALIVDLVVDGLPRLSWDFLTNFPSRRPGRAGILSAWVGTALVMLVTAALSVPLGVAAGLYLEEYAPKNWITDLIEINVTNLAGVPSIIYGLLALGLFVYGLGLGETILVAGMVLALLTLPVVIVATREAIRSIPQEVREGAYALGADQWQTVRMYILPAATPGILTGTIIGLARAIGETAPVITIGALTFIAFLPPAPIQPEFPFVKLRLAAQPVHAPADPDVQLDLAAAGRVSPERRRRRTRPAGDDPVDERAGDLHPLPHPKGHAMSNPQPQRFVRIDLPVRERAPADRQDRLDRTTVPSEPPGDRQAGSTDDGARAPRRRSAGAQRAPPRRAAGRKVDIRNLSFWYGDFQALKDISIPIVEREVTALIGPSGLRQEHVPALLQPHARSVSGQPLRGRDPALSGRDQHRRSQDRSDAAADCGSAWSSRSPTRSPRRSTRTWRRVCASAACAAGRCSTTRSSWRSGRPRCGTRSRTG